MTTTRRPTGRLGEVARLAQLGDEVDGVGDAVGILALGAQRVDAGKAEAEEDRVVVGGSSASVIVAAERLAVLDRRCRRSR